MCIRDSYVCFHRTFKFIISACCVCPATPRVQLVVYIVVTPVLPRSRHVSPHSRILSLQSVCLISALSCALGDCLCLEICFDYITTASNIRQKNVRHKYTTWMRQWNMWFSRSVNRHVSKNRLRKQHAKCTTPGTTFSHFNEVDVWVIIVW